MNDTKSEYWNQGRRFIRWGRQIAVLSCISILALLLSVWNAAEMQASVEESTREYCAGITEEIVEAINDGIYYKKIELENVADSLSNVYEKDKENELNEFLERKARILDFSAMLLLDKQGGCLARFVEPDLDLDEAQIFQLAMVRDSFSGTVNMGFCEGQNLCYSAPVYTDDAATHVLVGMRSQDNMQSLLSSKAFHGKTSSCIIDSQGQVVLSLENISAFSYLDNIFGEGVRGRAAEAAGEMEEDMKAGEDGIIRFVGADGKESFLAYNFLGSNGWILLTIVPVDLISGSTSVYVFRTFLVVLGLSLLFLLFLMVVYRFYSENRKQLNQIAFVDSVTGGMNYKAFQMSYRRAAREQKPFSCAVVLLNVRSFKLVNEKFGYAGGNEFLRYIYQVIDRHLNPDQEEFASRSVMDHFFLCLREQRPERVQERINEIVQDINDFRDTECPRYHLTFLQGCCLAEDSQIDIQTLQDRARMAVQEAAFREQDECVFYNEQIALRVKREQELDAMFGDALARHEFHVYLQPKVDLKTNSPKGAEALVRWKQPGKELIPPSEFIPLFERNGKICRLDLYVFEEICKFYQHRRKAGEKWYPVSVNLSRSHFYENESLEKFYQISEAYGIPPYSIEFELTESMFFEQEHIERVKKGIVQMHERGFRCSMDDFGCGYSSLGLLKEFDVDTLKMDRSFFQNVSSERGRDIIQSVVELAAKLNLETVAEGIEKAEQMDFLYSIHCDTVQGYFFSQPLPMQEFEHWISQYEE